VEREEVGEREAEAVKREAVVERDAVKEEVRKGV